MPIITQPKKRCFYKKTPLQIIDDVNNKALQAFVTTHLTIFFYFNIGFSYRCRNYIQY